MPTFIDESGETGAFSPSFRLTAVWLPTKDWQSAGPSVIHWACAVSLASTLRSVYMAEEARRAGLSNVTSALNELIVVDDNQDQNFLRVIKKKFRELRSGVKHGAPLVGKVKFKGSGPEELIQLADMVCGAFGAFLDGDETWYEIISSSNAGIVRIP